MIIYYVGAEVDFQSRQKLFHNFFSSEPPHPHATLIYSRKWFPYKTAKCFPLIIEPPYSYQILKDSLVLKFENYRFFQRYIELRNLGATSDFDHFISHITIGPSKNFEIYNQLENIPIPDFPITLSHEYYRTWEEEKEEKI